MSAPPALEPLATAVPGARLDQSLVRGIAWTAAAKWGSQVLSWASTIVVARLLSPGDYGLVGMAMIFLGLVTLLSEFGIGAAVVTLRDLTGDQIAQINSMAILIGVGCFGVSAAAALPLGRLFGTPQLPAIVLALGLAFPISSFRTVPYAIMQRGLRFRTLAIMEGVQMLVQAGASMVFAFLGFRYWALVLSGLLGTATLAALTVACAPSRFARPMVSSLRRALTYSWHIIVARLSWYVYSNADFFVAGKLLGKAALGAYTVAWTLASAPIDKITALVGQVTPAVFSAVQTDRHALRRYLLLLTQGLALITFPATLGLALVGDSFVVLALGEKWRAMVVPLQLLAAYATVRSITPLLPQVLNVTGETRFAMYVNVVSALLMPVAFLAGSRWGIPGIAAAWIVAHPLVTVPLYWRVCRAIDLRMRDYLRALWPAATCSLAMGGVVWILTRALPTGWPLWERFAIQVLGGAVAYVLALIAGHRERVHAVVRTLRLLRGGRTVSSMMAPNVLVGTGVDVADSRGMQP